MQIMNRKQLKKLWERSKADPEFRRLLLAMLCALGAAPSTTEDRLGVCALADYTLRKAGPAGRRDLRRRLKAKGWEF
jgi:hypothetical protein